MEKGIKHFNKEVKERLDICKESNHNLDFIDFLTKYMKNNNHTCYYTTFDHLNYYLEIVWYMDFKINERTGKPSKYLITHINKKQPECNETLPLDGMTKAYKYLAKRNFTYYTDNTQKLIEAYQSKI